MFLKFLKFLKDYASWGICPTTFILELYHEDKDINIQTEHLTANIHDEK